MLHSLSNGKIKLFQINIDRQKNSSGIFTVKNLKLEATDF